MTNQKGEEETRMATNELGSHFSAQITAPVPTSNSMSPVMMAGWLLLGGVVVAGLVGLAADAAGTWSSGLVIAVVAMGVALLVQAAVAKRLGGLTGDVYGMGIELAEAAALVAGCAVVRLAGWGL